MKIVEQNPYRQLGVFANSPTKERVANHNRLKAFLKVNKQVSFPLDLPQFFPVIERTAEGVADAEAKLTLPKDQVGYAQFWFVKSTPLDNIAFSNLFAGKTDEAMSIWDKKDNASSLQNRIVCSLIREDFATAMACAEKLYALPEADIISSLLGASTAVQVDSLAFHFIDTLCDEVDMDKVLLHINNVEWKEHIKFKAVQPLIAKIQEAIDAAKATRKQGSDARLNAGNKLMGGTKSLLAQLRKLLPKTDLQYQMIADKLGLEILQCGIDYYNASDEPDCAVKAMKLLEYALGIVVGKMAKDRCQENVNILKKIIAELPPAEIYNECKAIKDAELPPAEIYNECKAIKEILSDAVKGRNTIYAAETLLNNAKPHLQSMRNKVGRKNDAYLKLSTVVVSIALSKVIEAVNNAQQTEFAFPGSRIELPLDLEGLKKTINNAWEVTLMMDDFDMEYEFKANRYIPNRSTLKNIKNRICPEPTSSGSGCMVLISLFFVIIAGCAIISCRNSSQNGTAPIQSDDIENEASTTEEGYSKYTSDNGLSISGSDLADEEEKTFTRLETGTRPYAGYYEKSVNGDNYLDFKTSGDDDYVVIIKYYGTDRVADHIYIRGGDNIRMWLPDSRYSIYFYSGRDWDADKSKGDVKGGFAHRESLQKDEPVELHNMYGEYILYPVYDGNLQLQNANPDEAFLV